MDLLENKSRAAGFDPFNDRPSRTVRNTLAEMLRSCLGRREVFSEDPADLLQDYPQPPYADYIRDRVGRYRAATSEALPAMRFACGPGGHPVASRVIF